MRRKACACIVDQSSISFTIYLLCFPLFLFLATCKGIGFLFVLLTLYLLRLLWLPGPLACFLCPDMCFYPDVNVRCFTWKSSVCMCSNAVSTDCDAILHLFKALISAWESDNILILLILWSGKWASVNWHAWFMASILAWKTDDVAGMCIDSVWILLFLLYIVKPAPTPNSVLLPSV